MSNDRPFFDIETAPRDGTVIDIYLYWGSSGRWVDGVHWGAATGDLNEADLGWIKDGAWARGEDQEATLWRPHVSTKEERS